jgi:hypothetical protein
MEAPRNQPVMTIQVDFVSWSMRQAVTLLDRSINIECQIGAFVWSSSVVPVAQ